MAKGENYEEFTEKFKPKLTTDDCYTPEKVYNTILEWCLDRYGLRGRHIVRPFWPGGDYEKEKYPAGCVVIDNPPFSILARIEKFYLAHGIDFFLFAPGLTCFKYFRGLHYVFASEDIVYHNGAIVNTAFVTSLGGNLIETAPELGQKIQAVQKTNKPQSPKYEYPANIITAAQIGTIAAHGVRLEIPDNGGAVCVKAMDAQKEAGKSIFGGGFLVCDNSARVFEEAKERTMTSATAWPLSDREKEIVLELNARAAEGRQ